MQFTLSITLGNDAMQDASDLSRALMVLAERLDNYGFDGTALNVYDENGGRVGDWSIS